MGVKKNKKVNNKVIVGILLLIIGVVLIVIGYFVTSNKQSDNITNNDKYQFTAKYYKDVESAITKLNMFLIDEFPINDISKISDKAKTKFLLDILNDKDDSKLSIDRVETENDKYFDINGKVYLETIKNQTNKIMYEYNSKNKAFISRNNNYVSYVVNSKVINTKVNSNKLITKRKLYFVEKTVTGSEYPKRVYKSISDATKKQNAVFTIGDAQHLFTDEEYEKVKKEFATYTYTFVKMNKKYKIKSIKINK